MALIGKAGLSTRPNMAVGLSLTGLVHAGLVAGAVLLHKQVAPEPEPRLVNVVEAKLVRLGTPLPEHMLPRLEAAPPPPPPPEGVKVTPRETPAPEPPKAKERPRREENPEAELEKRLRRETSTPREDARASRPGAGRASTGGASGIGDPRGDPEGEVLSARDQIQGNLWLRDVRRALHRAWDIPDVISESDLRRLRALVIIRVDADGTIREWRMKQPASGSRFADLFNGSVNQVSRKVRALPAPTEGALKFSKGGWVAVNFTKAEQEKAR